MYTEPAPQFKNVKASGSTDGSYYTWVDQFDTPGLGCNLPKFQMHPDALAK